MTKRLALAAAILAATISLYYLTRPTPVRTERGGPVALMSQQASESPGTPGPEERREEAVSERPRTETLPEKAKGNSVSTEEPQTAMPTLPPQPAKSEPAAIDEITGPDEEVENVQFMVRGYRDAHGENPVGNNSEITKALMGDNARQVKMPLPVGSHLNERGELSDRWGKPYFFHQLSAKEIEIRSAGPDQKMWTGDDILAR